MILDIIVAVTIALGFYLGFNRGLIKTVFDTLSLVIGILIALKLSTIVSSYVDQLLQVSRVISHIIGIVITFLMVLAIIRFVGKQLERFLKAIKINLINKMAGGILQAFFFAFLLSMVLWLLGNFKLLNEETKTSSLSYSLLEPLPEMGREVFVRIEPVFREFWLTTQELLEGVKENATNESNE